MTGTGAAARPRTSGILAVGGAGPDEPEEGWPRDGSGRRPFSLSLGQ